MTWAELRRASWSGLGKPGSPSRTLAIASLTDLVEMITSENSWRVGVTLSFISAILCWLPITTTPRLDFPWWVALCGVGLSAAISSFLNPPRWPALLLSSGMGTFVGLCVGYAIWWPRDPIAGPWVPIVVLVITGVAAVVAIVGAWIGARLPVPDRKLRRAAWFALVGIAASGSVCLALTPPLVARRVARNERLAEKRLTSLQRAVQHTLAATPDHVCAGPLLARNYFGPPFSNVDWRRMTGNYVKQDGYFFMIYCRDGTGYVIDAMPARDGQDGTRRFCADESGKIGCGMKWNRSRHACVPCQE